MARTKSNQPKALPTADRLRRRLLEGAAVFLAAVAAYANTIHAEFTLDDLPIVQENESIRSLSNLGEFFKTNYWGESGRFPDKSLYRPMTVATYALDYAVHGLSPRGYHLVNIVLHAAVSLLLYALIITIFGDARTALLSGVLFAVHPVHSEVVAGIVGRAEIMALLGGLLGCLTFHLATRDVGPAARRGAVWAVASILAYAFGVFSKEIGFVAPVLVLLWEIILPNRRRLFRGNGRAVAIFVGYVLVATAYLALRSSAIRTNNINVGFIGVSMADRLWTALRVCAEYVGLLFGPVTLSADYWKPEVPFARSPLETGVLVALLVLAVMIGLVVAAWRRWPALAWGLSAFLAVLFPVSNLPFRIGVLKAERILYSPSVGFVVALAAVAATTLSTKRSQRTALAGLWILATVFFVRTWARNKDWRDNCTLAAATLRTSPSSPIFNNIMATCYRQRKQNGPAREHLLRTLDEQPNNVAAIFNLGNIELDERRFDKAIEYYRLALEYQPDYISALNNLGRALAEAGRLREAADVLERSRKVQPDNAAAYANLLSILIQLKDIDAALPLADEALRRYPDLAIINWNAGSAYLLAGKQAEARALHERAKSLDPNIETRRDIKSQID